jgi:hypothetical protein
LTPDERLLANRRRDVDEEERLAWMQLSRSAGRLVGGAMEMTAID